MAKKRFSLYMILPFLITVSVVAFFFIITEPTSWPAEVIDLGSKDMRLTPYTSTFWCESVSLLSSGDYVAYRVAHRPKINSKALTKQIINLKFKMDNRGRPISVKNLRYFLLPGSIVRVRFCASRENTDVHIFKHNFSLQCFEQYRKEQTSEDEDGSKDDSDEDLKRRDNDILKYEEEIQTEECSKAAMLTSEVPTVNEGNKDSECPYAKSGSLVFNVTSEDVYVIVIANKNRQVPNYVKLQIRLDRTFYDYHKIKKSTLMCGGSTTFPSTCNVPLTFASKERILIWIPQIRETMIPQEIVTISAQCRPRIAFFALLTVILPISLFAVVSFVLRTDRKRLREQRLNFGNSVNETHTNRLENFASPLLQEPRNFTNQTINTSLTPCETRSDNNLPPSYETIFDPPPSYNSLKFPSEKP